MRTLLEWLAFLAIFGTIAFVAIRLWSAAMERFCRDHGYHYRSIDPEAEAKARPLIGQGNAQELVSGSKSGHSFLFCIRSWSGTSSTSHHSSNVLVDLREPLPPFAIREIDKRLPVTLTVDVPGIRIRDDGGFSARYHIAGPDETAVRSVVTPAVRAAFVASGASQLLCDGRTMLCTWPGRPAWPPRIERLIECAVRAADALAESAAGVVAAAAVTARETAAPPVVPPSPVRRIRFGSFLAGATFSVLGAVLAAVGGVFAVAAWLAGVLDGGAPRGLIVMFAASLGGIIVGPILMILARRAFREKPRFGGSAGAPAEVDAVTKVARRYANLLIAKQASGRGELIDPSTTALLRGLASDGERSAALEKILAGEAVADLGEVCRALVELETGISPRDGKAYERLTRAVDQELSAARRR